MDSTIDQQAYDRGSTLFSPDGRLYQVEYAREAVERGSPSVGVVAGDGVVLAARKRRRSPLLASDTIAKLHSIDDHVAVASAGHAADARQLVDLARRASQHHRVRYGEPIGVDALATHLADRIQTNTQEGGARPYGVALLVAGVERNRGGQAKLFEVDPSGTASGWNAVAIGTGAEDHIRFFEERFDEASERASDEADGTNNADDDRAWRRTTAIDALQQTAEGDLDVDQLAVWELDAEHTEVLSESTIERHLAAS